MFTRIFTLMVLSVMASSAMAVELCGQIQLEGSRFTAEEPSVLLIAPNQFTPEGGTDVYLLSDDQGGALVSALKRRNGQKACVEGTVVSTDIKTLNVRAILN